MVNSNIAKGQSQVFVDSFPVLWKQTLNFCGQSSGFLGEFKVFVGKFTTPELWDYLEQ